MCVIGREDIEAVAADLAELQRQARKRQARAQGIEAQVIAQAYERRVAVLQEIREFLEARMELVELRVLGRVIGPHPSWGDTA